MTVFTLLLLLLALAVWFSTPWLGQYDSECGKCYGDAMTMVFITIVVLVVFSFWLTNGCR